jgi:cyclase
LLVHKGGLVKTERFAKPKYVGDPINAVRIFNDKEVDEIIVLDIDATVDGRKPDYELIRRLAAECRMPLCYGGGVSAKEDFERIVALGVEKVAVGAACVTDPDLISLAAAVVGSQSVVAVADVRLQAKTGLRTVVTHNGQVDSGIELKDFAHRMRSRGAGELLINSVDRDGTMKGYDLDLIADVRKSVDCPITALGGAGSLKDIGDVIARFGILGVSAGSLFVFKGVYRAVLINYPKRAELESMTFAALQRAGVLS